MLPLIFLGQCWAEVDGQSHERHSQIDKGVRGAGPALGLGVGREGILDVRGFSQGSRSTRQGGMGILSGLGLGPGIRQDSRSARGGLALQDCTPHAAVWGEDEKRGDGDTWTLRSVEHSGHRMLFNQVKDYGGTRLPSLLGPEMDWAPWALPLLISWAVPLPWCLL